MNFIGLIFFVIFIVLIASSAETQKKAKMQEQANKEAARRFYENMSTGSSYVADTAGQKADDKPFDFERVYAQPEADTRGEAAHDTQIIKTSPMQKRKAQLPSSVNKVLSDLPSAIIASEILSKPKALRRFRY